MSKRKPAKEVLKDGSEKQLTEILIEELKAVGIEYIVDSDRYSTEFVPLSDDDTMLIMEDCDG